MNPLRLSLLHAVCYLRDRPLCADAQTLLEVTLALVRAVHPRDEVDCALIGQMAAKECARPTKQLFCDLINPKDLE